MGYTNKLTEALALVGTIDPQAIDGGGDVSSDVVDMQQHRRAVVAVLEGKVVTTAMTGTAMTIEIFECTAAGTPASTALKTATITGAQTTANLGQQRMLEVRDTELGTVHKAYNRYFKAKVTAGTNAVQAGVVILAGESRYSGAEEMDLSTCEVE